MKNLEKIIRDNLDAFNSEEPGPDHFDKFREKLGISEQRTLEFHRSPWALRIAAAILVLLTISVFLFDSSLEKLRNMLTDRTASVVYPAEVNEAMQFYAGQATLGMTELNQLAGSGPEAQKVKAMAENDIRSLDANSAELVKAFRENPNDERITAALIRNQQMKETIVNNMIKQLNLVKK
jgi:hypothetical protein